MGIRLSPAEVIAEINATTDRRRIEQLTAWAEQESAYTPGQRAEYAAAARHGRETLASMPTCQWYALCTNPAEGTLTHPILGNVPTCQRCAGKHGKELSRV